MIHINIDKQQILGKIKPMNCINNFPSMSNLFNDSFKELNIPYSRLHDTAMLNAHLVDICAVFPNIDADENDENSYDFVFTDYFIKRLYDLGTQVFYRLGASIENYQSIKPYNIYPPKDYKKWANICEHIIMHYNEGWNNGFYFGLKYWEIWNEPENYPDIADNQMWKGTFEEFMDLYEITSNHLKACFPELKIGGYSSCGFYAIFEEKSAEQANSTSRTDYFIECIEKFLKHISSEKHKSPLDFFSWHSYSGVKINIAYARYCRKLLDKYGFYDTESNLNEWNTGIQLRGTLQDSSNILANMLALQNEPLDMLMYYDIRLESAYCGLYNPINNGAFKAYYSFKAFSYLAEIGTQVKTEVKGEVVYAISAYDGKKGLCLITNNSEKCNDFSIKGINIKEIYILSDEKNLEKINNINELYLKSFESVLIKF